MGLLDYTSFLKESLILEKVDIKGWKKYMYDELEKFIPGISYLSGKAGELRANFGADSATAQTNILNFFQKHLEFTDAKIEDLGIIGEQKNVAYTQYDGTKFTQSSSTIGSSSFPTYKITTKGDTFYVTNTGAKGKSVGKKKTTPDELGVTDVQFRTADELANTAIKKIQSLSSTLYQPAADYMIDCINSVLANSPAGKWDNVNKLLEDPARWSIPPISLSKDHTGLSSGDVNDIVNDFGELLDGIFLLKAVTNIATSTDTSLHGLIFPGKSNYALADILLDGIRVSSKAEKGGGKPSVQAVIEEISSITPQIMHNKGISLTPQELELKTMFDFVSSNLKVGQWLDSVEVYLYFAEQLVAQKHADKAVLKRLDYLKTSIGADVSKPSIISFLDSKTAEEKKSWLEDYWNSTGFSIRKAIDYNKPGKDLIAAVYYPLAGEVVELLNSSYGDAFTTLIRKFVVYKQIYLGIDAKQNPDTLKFSGVSSKVIPSVKFVARASASNWSAGMGFELKL